MLSQAVRSLWTMSGLQARPGPSCDFAGASPFSDLGGALSAFKFVDVLPNSSRQRKV
jgi:hypothetical protein